MVNTKDRLERYRGKRSAAKTPEPFGNQQIPATGRLFVFHKHHARNLHWDLRLEWEGALESWAVPKGPSPNPKDKRLAMHVEPHPLDYGEFEGVIPAGQYGAGPSIVWDKGIWIPKEDIKAGFQKGKLLFELWGFKVRGLWTLIHTPRAGPNNWLLIKEKDAFVDPRGTEAYVDESIYSGLVVDDLPRAEEIAAELAGQAEKAGARRARVRADQVEVMKATPRERAFTDKDWVFELKYDGYRLLAQRKDEDSAVLISRNGNDLTNTFPEIARAVRGLPYADVLLDGEVAVLDERGVPSFDRLQRRGKLTRKSDVARAALELPAVYFAFDLLAFGGLDLRKLPLVERKKILQQIVPPAGPIKFSEHIAKEGEKMMEHVLSLDLEGVVAKKADSAYVGGRTKLWYKIRAERSDDFIVVGWKDPQGSRSGFGSLDLAWYVRGELTYAGAVGTGFDERKLREILKLLKPLELEKRPALAGDVPKGRDHHWVKPEVVVEVRFREITTYGIVRHGVFLRIRDDKTPRECVKPEGIEASESEDADVDDGADVDLGYEELADEAVKPGKSAKAAKSAKGKKSAKAAKLAQPTKSTKAAKPLKTTRLAKATKAAKEAKSTTSTKAAKSKPPAASKVVEDRHRHIAFSNPGKIFWPEDGYTKNDLIEYYRAVWPWLEPWLADRPVVLTRFPDGIHGKSFYQKDAPSWTPDWIRTVPVSSDSQSKTLNYFVADNLETLLYLVNLGTIPLHIWHSRASAIEHPDWCLIDLDPKEAPFSHVVECALFLHDLCEEIELPHYVKTTGSSGLHILIPLGGQMDYDQSRTLGELLANMTVKALPKIATVERALKSRGGKVYVDFMQNREGQLMAAPYCARPREGAPVSAPLEWKEVGPKLGPRDFTIGNMLARMKKLEKKGVGDTCLPALTERPDLLGALERLTAR
jgi:bifunctional non-homologous end joining protein LigD